MPQGPLAVLVAQGSSAVSHDAAHLAVPSGILLPCGTTTRRSRSSPQIRLRFGRLLLHSSHCDLLAQLLTCC